MATALKRLARSALKVLPSPAQQVVQIVRNPMPHFSARRQTRFANSEREYVFQCIERFCRINRPIRGYYMEFGCHSGTTMRMAWRHTKQFDWHYLAFDSFEGLPEISAIDRQDIWAKGKLKTGEEEFLAIVTRAGMPRDRVTTVKGFYAETLTDALRERLASRLAAVVYVDCDLYESAVPVLRFARPFLQLGTIVVFDDWDCFKANPDKGERRAWREFLEANPSLRFEEFCRVSMAKAFVCVGL